MNIEKTLVDKTLTFKLEGELNTTTAPELDEMVAAGIEDADNVVFDMEELTYITSAGLRILLFSQQAVDGRGAVTIRGARPEIRELIEMTGFDTILNLE